MGSSGPEGGGVMATMLGDETMAWGKRGGSSMLPRSLPAWGFYNYMLDSIWEHAVHVGSPEF